MQCPLPPQGALHTRLRHPSGVLQQHEGTQLCLGPLTDKERRKLVDGKWVVQDLQTGQQKAVVPDNFDFSTLPMLITIADQGPLNLPGLDYLQFKHRMVLLPRWDIYHRSWNDMKAALKSAKLFKTLLQFSLLYNLNYGPGNTKAWFSRKEALAKEYRLSGSSHQDPFLAYIPHICEERGVPEPSNARQREELFSEILELRSVTTHGPLVKLMRWFSYWECFKFYEGECWFNKLILSAGSSPHKGLDEDILPPDLVDGNLTDREELRRLKLSLGSFALAPRLVTSESMWKNLLLITLGTPVWSAHSARAKEVKTAHEVQQATATSSAGAWSQEIVQLLDDGYHKLGKLYVHSFAVEENSHFCHNSSV